MPNTVTSRLLLLGLLLSSVATPGRAQAWEWATAPLTPGGDSAPVKLGTVAIDIAGNTYVLAGSGDSLHLGGLALPSRTEAIVKLNPQGRGIWVMPLPWGTPWGDSGNWMITADFLGNVTIAGSFYGSITFGSTTLSSPLPMPRRELVVARLSPSGQWQWATSTLTTSHRIYGDVFPLTLALGPNGEAWVGGMFSDTLTLGTHQLYRAQAMEGLVARLSATGQWLGAWAATSSQPYGVVRPWALTIDGNGTRAYVTGDLDGDPAFGATQLPRPPANLDELRGFVACLDVASDTWQWARQWGVAWSPAKGTGVVVDPVSGDPIVGGFFNAAITLDTISLVPGGNQSTSGLLGRLDRYTGAWRWARQTSARGQGGPGIGAMTLGHRPIGPLYVLQGSFNAGITTADLATGQLTPYVWAPTGNNAAVIRSIAADGAGTVVLTGEIGTYDSSPLYFGSQAVLPAPNPTHNPYQRTGFLARLNTHIVPTGLPAEVRSAGFTLLPNPAHGAVRLEGAAGAPAEIVDALGRTVRTADLAPLTSHLLNLQGLPPGLYLVRCGSQTRRLVVE